MNDIGYDNHLDATNDSVQNDICDDCPYLADGQNIPCEFGAWMYGTQDEPQPDWDGDDCKYFKELQKEPK